MRVLVLLVAVLLAGLPVAVWLDLRSVTASALTRQAGDLSEAVTGIRGFYATDVVDRVLAGRGTTMVTDDYRAHPGAIPIPATFSLELGALFRRDQKNIMYRFVSDMPFKHRAPHPLDAFERDALAALRAGTTHEVREVSFHGRNALVRLVTPIVMAPSCVACHNTHPDSPKRDWRVGDVRGIQELAIVQPLAPNVFSFKWLLLYFAFAVLLCSGFIAVQRQQQKRLASISRAISRYLSPQIIAGIFSGRTDVGISTKRKKLTIFFSDIESFTSTTEQLQPEELTALLNEYFTEMSAIALAHGGTIDKFVGDAMLVFFGDPESKGVAEDAAAAVRMAVAMQARLAELNAAWRARGIERPFRARMGINTGYCNVGNFGSATRMDYTIIGAEANLAARLESTAEPGRIVIGYETYALVREFVDAHPGAPMRVKGISREIVPYVVDGLRDDAGERREIVNVHATGLDLYLDVGALDAAAADRARTVLRDALAALER